MFYRTTWALDRCLPANRLVVNLFTTTGMPGPGAADPVQAVGPQAYESGINITDECFVGYATLVDTVTGDLLGVQSINVAAMCAAAKAALLDITVLAAATANDGSVAGALKALLSSLVDTDANF